MLEYHTIQKIEQEGRGLSSLEGNSFEAERRGERYSIGLIQYGMDLSSASLVSLRDGVLRHETKP